MSRLLIAAVVGLSLCATVHADIRAETAACRVDSDYDIRLGLHGITLRRDEGHPGELRLQAGRLWIDGDEVPLSAPDRDTLAGIQREVDALLPEVRALAIETADITVEALVAVAGAFDERAGQRVVQRLKDARGRLVERLDRAFAEGSWDAEAFEHEVAKLADEMAAQIAGSMTGMVMKAIFRGGEAMEREMEERMAKLESRLEQAMAERARRLTQRAATLCGHVERIDALEEALELRLADGSRLDLVRL